MSKKTVTFLSTFANYIRGDVAGFDAARADDLIARGVAAAGKVDLKAQPAPQIVNDIAAENNDLKAQIAALQARLDAAAAGGAGEIEAAPESAAIEGGVEEGVEDGAPPATGGAKSAKK